MTCKKLRERCNLFLLAMIVAPGSVIAGDKNWPQWGGPNRNFTVETTGLADEWPVEGPPKLWYRELGSGYSAIICDDGVLYTMYRKEQTSENEYTVALDAATGKTLWKHENLVLFTAPDDSEWGGQGPNSTPLVVGDRLYTVGSNAVMHCFDKRTGEVNWKHDLVTEFGAVNLPKRGFCSSPIAYRNTVIVPIGCPRLRLFGGGQSLVAFDRATGQLAWKNLTFRRSESSPIVIEFSGQDQLVFHADKRLLGVSPDNGRPLWSHSIPDSLTIVTPVWNGADMLVCAAGGTSAVSRGFKFLQGKTKPQEVWASAKIGPFVSTPVRIDDFICGSTGQAFYGADIKTGKRLWAKRGFKDSSCVHADGKLIILDSSGWLTLAMATRDDLTIHSKCLVTGRCSFTVPTLVGKTLYVRDKKHIMALDLGKHDGNGE